MNKTLTMTAFIAAMAMAGCKTAENAGQAATANEPAHKNTLLAKSENKHGIESFDKLTNDDYREAIIEGSLSRLNPILMTALTSALALVPLALGGDLPGNEIQSPMAKVILGGLISSTLLNAFIVPIIYEKISNRHNRGTQRV